MKNNTIWTLTTILCHAITLGLLIATVIGDVWATIELRHGVHIINGGQVVDVNGGLKGNYGLWRYCHYNTTICVRINHFYGKTNPDWFKATQIAATTSCIFALSAFLSALVKPCAKDCASVIAALNMFLAWICITGALAVFAAKEPTNDSDEIIDKRSWGWSFIVGWTSSGMSFLSSIIAWLAYTPKKDEPEVDMFFIH